MGIKEDLQDLEDKIAKGLSKAYERMIAFKEYKKTPIIMAKDGKVIEVYPKDLKKDNT